MSGVTSSTVERRERAQMQRAVGVPPEERRGAVATQGGGGAKEAEMGG